MKKLLLVFIFSLGMVCRLRPETPEETLANATNPLNASIEASLYFIKVSKSIEAQAYGDGGQISMLWGSRAYQTNEVYGLVGANFKQPRSIHVHDEEYEQSAEFASGWRHWWDPEGRGFFAGLRAGFLYTNIQWKDTATESRGDTGGWTFEPEVQLGWRFDPSRSQSKFIDLFVAAGQEFNIQLNPQENYGQGIVSSFGLAFGWK